MKNRERCRAALNFEPVDRLPMIEWAGWWDKTLDRWQKEGLEYHGDPDALREDFGLDMVRQFWIWPHKSTFPHTFVRTPDDYKRIKEHMYPESLDRAIDTSKIWRLKDLHERGEVVVWITLNGFFWNPRTLFGIENHLYAFYDYPDLMHEMNKDLTEYHLRIVEEFCGILEPDFMTFAEDMSYNHGPMLSRELFNEFLLPYYRHIVPVLKKHNILPFVDTDGNLESMIPWLAEAGIEGALPLERQAGVDVARIRKNHPSFRLIGAYDKMVMSKGEEEMRREFERLLPVMKCGGFIPSCDHQTPPEVSLANYRVYLALLKEYCEKAGSQR
ncbi:MAG: uroporphyrinogen decarboxylase family protein [Bacillota bacterium]